MRPTPAAIEAGLVVLSQAMLDVVTSLEVYAPARGIVIFVGATGTGKSLFARLLHERSGRQGPFRSITAGELHPNLAEDRLFGHVKGAFTGADRRRDGTFAAADGGTLMLDDFHLLERPLQYLLLRAIEEGLYQAVGSDLDVPLGCRLLVGMGVEPDVLVAQGRLLADLRHRMGEAIVRFPLLGERREEIVPFTLEFLRRAPVDTGVPGGPSECSREALAVLEAAAYPGNVRQLRDTVRTAYLRARHAGESVLRVEHLPERIQRALCYEACASREEQLALVELALRKTGGRIERAARLIGAHRNTVRARRDELKARRLREDDGAARDGQIASA